MMICSRTKNEGFIISDNIFVTVVEIREDEVVLAIDAPNWVRVSNIVASDQEHLSKLADIEDNGGMDLHQDSHPEALEMATTDFTPHLERLVALRARLRGDVSQMASNTLTSDQPSRMPNHMAELGSESFDQELNLSLLGSEGDALFQIEAAIRRIEEGTYGRCEECGRKIPKTRLEAIPYAAQCVRCASREEGDFQPRILPR